MEQLLFPSSRVNFLPIGTSLAAWGKSQRNVCDLRKALLRQCDFKCVLGRYTDNWLQRVLLSQKISWRWERNQEWQLGCHPCRYLQPYWQRSYLQSDLDSDPFDWRNVRNHWRLYDFRNCIQNKWRDSIASWRIWHKWEGWYGPFPFENCRQSDWEQRVSP